MPTLAARAGRERRPPHQNSLLSAKPTATKGAVKGPGLPGSSPGVSPSLLGHLSPVLFSFSHSPGDLSLPGPEAGAKWPACRAPRGRVARTGRRTQGSPRRTPHPPDLAPAPRAPGSHSAIQAAQLAQTAPRGQGSRLERGNFPAAASCSGQGKQPQEASTDMGSSPPSLFSLLFSFFFFFCPFKFKKGEKQ